MPKPKLYTEASIQVAIEEVKNGASVRSTAKKYHISVSMLRKRCLQSQGLVQLGERGRKPRLSAATEEKLATCIRQMAGLGFGPTLEELKVIVFYYLEANELGHVFDDKKPGDDWANNFMRRHKLSLKKAGLMQIARKNVTSDPFVIYEFYSLLERTVNQLGIANRPECIWNLDESGFPSDPSRWKTIGPVGCKTVRVSCGSNRENTTVLAVCCANGEALDPLIVFRGKNIMSNWRGDEVLPKTYYAVSESGWMTTSIFHNWFEKFVDETKHIRPLLLIFDGHLTHMSVLTIELAMKENITLLKLPAHCTDVLQPLDVSCFNPLKSYYERELTEQVHKTGAREPLRKAAFGNLISKIWRKGLNENNIKAGFRATGIYPVDASKYKAERLDKVKLVSYNAWVAAGKPISDDGSPVLTNQRDDQHTEHANLEVSLTTPDDHHPSTSSTRITPATPLVSTDGKQNARRSLSFTSPGTSSSTTSLSSALDHASPQELVRALQKHAPPGMRYEISLVCKEDETSFEKIIKSRGRPSTSSQPQKRHKVSMHGAVISDEKFLQQQKEKESKKNTAKKKQAEVIKDSDTDSPSPIESDSSDLSDIDDENQDRLKKTVSRSLRRKELRAMLPEKKDIEKDMFYAVYYDKPCSYYWGRVEKILKETEDSEVSEVEMKFLKRSVPSSDPKCLRWDWPLMSDCEIVPVSHIFGGPATPTVENKSRGKPLFYFTEELKVFEMFKAASRYGFHSPKKDVH